MVAGFERVGKLALCSLPSAGCFIESALCGRRHRMELRRRFLRAKVVTMPILHEDANWKDGLHLKNVLGKEGSERETIDMDSLLWCGCGGGFAADGAGAGYGQAG